MTEKNKALLSPDVRSKAEQLLMDLKQAKMDLTEKIQVIEFILEHTEEREEVID